ncbi:MAG: pyruvate kinase [Pseudomonadota bacterium]
MGVNLPSSGLRLAALTEKDKKDLDFGLELGVDYIALSFVRRAEEIQELREICERKGPPDTDHRQDRDALRGRAAGFDRACCRRGHGCAR